MNNLKPITKIESELQEKFGRRFSELTLSNVLRAIGNMYGRIQIGFGGRRRKYVCLSVRIIDIGVFNWKLSKNLLRHQGEETVREIHKLLLK